MPKFSLTPKTQATVDELSWVTGSWNFRSDEGGFEEHWSQPAAHTMIGMFRWYGKEGIRFYEIIVLEEENDGVVMRIRHFNRGLQPWENETECVELDLVESDAHTAVFSMRNKDVPTWLVYQEVESNRLEVWFEREDQESSPENRFRFEKAA